MAEQLSEVVRRKTYPALRKVETEFMTRAGIPENYFPRFLSRTAERVAQEGYDGLMRGRRVVIPGSKNKGAAWLARLLPRRVVLWMLRRVSGA